MESNRDLIASYRPNASANWNYNLSFVVRKVEEMLYFAAATESKHQIIHLILLS